MRTKLLLAAFLAASVLMALWLLANWFDWAMADFDCVSGYWKCREDIVGRMTLRIGVAAIGWTALAVPLAREWKRS